MGRSVANTHQRETITAVLALRSERSAFEDRWPALASGTPMPMFTWEQLERQLASLADDPRAAEMAPTLLSATRKMARFKPAEMVLREILCLAIALGDESFQPTSQEGGMP